MLEIMLIRANETVVKYIHGRDISLRLKIEAMTMTAPAANISVPQIARSLLGV